MNRLPSWFKQEIPDEMTFEMEHVIGEFGVHTVCQEARCPNLAGCFKNSHITFMLLGDACTRNCRFCAVDKSEKINLPFDREEPSRVVRTVRKLGLKYVVITSVSRDDLSDGGAAIFSETIGLLRGENEGIKIEVLVPDLQGKASSLRIIIDSKPSVLAHNIETIRRLYAELRPQADYDISLGILKKAKESDPGIITKSSLMLGLGETEEEVISTMKDLRGIQCDILTLGQYLTPSAGHYPVREFITPGQFKKYRDSALSLGFKGVLSGPCVRSSYQAEELYREVLYV